MFALKSRGLERGQRRPGTRHFGSGPGSGATCHAAGRGARRVHSTTLRQCARYWAHFRPAPPAKRPGGDCLAGRPLSRDDGRRLRTRAEGGAGGQGARHIRGRLLLGHRAQVYARDRRREDELGLHAGHCAQPDVRGGLLGQHRPHRGHPGARRSPAGHRKPRAARCLLASLPRRRPAAERAAPRAASGAAALPRRSCTTRRRRRTAACSRRSPSRRT